MNPNAERLTHLCDVVEREIRHLQITDQHLFAQPFTLDRVANLATHHSEAERVDAFVARFARLQDTTGDKLLPAVLRLLGNQPGPAIDNLNLLEKWGWLEDAQLWLETRWLRNRMIHDYIMDAQALADALNTAHERVPLLIRTAQTLLNEARHRLDAS